MDASARDNSGKTLRLRDVRLGSLDVAVERRPDGIVYLRNKHRSAATPRASPTL